MSDGRAAEHDRRRAHPPLPAGIHPRPRGAGGARPWFGLTHGDGTGPRPARLATAAELVASLDAAGIAAAVVCGWPWRDGGRCRAHNDYLLDAARRHPGRLRPLAIVAPRDGRAAVREAARCLDAGAAGLGELNADAQGFDLAEPAPLAPLAGLLGERGRPLLLHASEPSATPTPARARRRRRSCCASSRPSRRCGRSPRTGAAACPSTS